MKRALVAAVLMIAARAAADQTFTGRDGVVWTVRADEREGGRGDHEARTLHVLRDGEEVASFVESSSSQYNPRMETSTSCEFRLDPHGALAVTTTRSRSRVRGGVETTVTTVVEHTWNGTAFVEGNARTRTTSRRR